MKIAKRRRREGKTDYLKRKNLLKSGKPRVVIRKTNRYLIAQYIVSKEAKDQVKIGLKSTDLLKYNWPKENLGGLKSISATYLLGFLMVKKIIKEKLEQPIADFGMIRIIHKNKLFAFLKGLIDAGLKINCEKESFPSEERIKGEHLKNKINFEEIKSKINSE
jgi:large subunit ribosomal protein L18